MITIELDVENGPQAQGRVRRGAGVVQPPGSSVSDRQRRVDLVDQRSRGAGALQHLDRPARDHR